jgi:N-acetylmuramoyl-L-alanine amidase
MNRILTFPPEFPIIPAFQHISAPNPPKINTSTIRANSRISLIPNAFNPTRINTSGAKDLKSIRINTSGNKDLKSFRISTSKKHPRGPKSDRNRPSSLAPTFSLPQAPVRPRFCYPQFVRIPKFLALLPVIAAGALLARAGAAAQSISPPAPQSAPFVVVLDPGHGGADPGAHGSAGFNESDIVLAMARQIRSALQAQGITVLLTRDADVDPSFDDRSAVANAHSGAIFLSLHVSSTGIPGSVRVYSLPMVSAQPAVSQMPSAAGLLPPPVAEEAPHPGLRTWDNAQDSFLDLSRRLAELLQTQMAQRFRGSPPTPAAVAVRQLRTIAAPAVAIEVSSISVADRAQLDAMDGPLAEAVVRAVLDFEPSYISGAAAAGAR